MSSNAPGSRRGRQGGGGRGRSGNNSRRNNKDRLHQQRMDPRPPDSIHSNSGSSEKYSLKEEAIVPDTSSVLRDEDILIAFMPFLKADNPEASRIHEAYQATHDQEAFIKAARALIQRHRDSEETYMKQSTPPPSQLSSRNHQIPTQQHAHPFEFSTQIQDPSQSQQYAPSQHLPPRPNQLSSQNPENMYRLDPSSLFGNSPLPSFLQPGSASDEFANAPRAQSHQQEPFSSPNITAGMDALNINNDPMVVMHSIWGSSPITPPRSTKPAASLAVGSKSGPSSPWAPASSTADFQVKAFLTPPRAVDNESTAGISVASRTAMPSPSTSLLPEKTGAAFFEERPDPAGSSALSAGTQNAETLTSVSRLASPVISGTPVQSTELPKKFTKPPATRLWTHFEEQPGRLLVNGLDGHDPSLVLKFRPRQELFAYWSLPLKYMEQNRKGKSLDDALKNLAIGLFRRGCAENASQSSIISKFVVERNDFGVDSATQTVRGKLPFFSPRTPGHVVLRLYWHDDPLYTLASGPTLLVQVTEQDFDSGIRFVLSNFKAKKTNPTSLSSLMSLAQVMETQLTVPNESAARAIWGCIQESRKVIEVCNSEYNKTCSKLQELEVAVEELTMKIESDGGDVKAIVSSNADDAQDEDVALLREKTRILMSGRASNLRKWRDAQLAFASILRAAINNPSLSMLLRRDMITKMRAEYQLWCPLSEEFAMPDESSRLWYDSLRDVPGNNLSAEEVNLLSSRRTKMQLRTLGFEPNTLSFDEILFPRAATAQRSMDAGAVNVLNNLSAAMATYFRELYDDEERVDRLRELIRAKAEELVVASGAFPTGTRVVIFGSSANGFGSPKSDIDMSLILPPDQEFAKDDNVGAKAMEKLAICLSEGGMEEVDASRLTARIPIIRFFCPNLLPSGKGDDMSSIECDLSMHNPLAVLNTSLLRTYAEITPITRVLAAVIKRWAKARDINNPSRHTLSSYGYILMLLHFLTFHKRNEKGLVVPIAPPEGNHDYRQNPNQQGRPLLPNLQWMDPVWPKLPGAPYRELALLPDNSISHPFEEDKRVNAYFYRPATPPDKANLQSLFPGHDLSLAILLASFFRYYAYEFDYRKCVVSLHSNGTRGLMQREVKTELDCWRNYSAALTIEDPFETFYDVAHVLRGGDYHRIRREFAVAYTKIADASTGRPGSWNKPDLRSMTGEALIAWICEPIEHEKLPHA